MELCILVADALKLYPTFLLVYFPWQRKIALIRKTIYFRTCKSFRSPLQQWWGKSIMLTFFLYLNCCFIFVFPEKSFNSPLRNFYIVVRWPFISKTAFLKDKRGLKKVVLILSLFCSLFYGRSFSPIWQWLPLFYILGMISKCWSRPPLDFRT